ncbi:MAG: OstA-like protein [Chitinophagales bacterium]
MYIKSCIIFIFIFPIILFAQSDSTKVVEIIHADKLIFNTLEDGSSVRKIVGNVQLKQEETLMFCDSAFMYKEDNKIDAVGNIRIEDGDSIKAFSDTLKYDGNAKIAHLIGNAELTDGDMRLTSQTLLYDTENDVGSYDNYGKLTNDSTVLTSIKAKYFADSKDAFFKDSVVIIDPEFELISDTMRYNTGNKVAQFYGPTTIYNDSSTINCTNGIYDTDNGLAYFGAGTVINNPPQVLYADSLYYERNNGYGKALKYFDWYDAEMKAGMTGTSAEYFENNQKIIAYNRPILNVQVEEDTMYMSGDIVRSEDNIVSNEKQFEAFHSVRIFKSDMQGVCDSLYFSFADSLFRMYDNPIVWNEQNEMKGDTMFIQLKNEEIDHLVCRENSFIVSQAAGKLFDQVKGKYITGYFANSELQKVFVNKNAHSLYFGKNDADEFVGGNDAKSSTMWVYMEEQEISRISFIETPEAIFTPMSQMGQSQLYLDGFSWSPTVRPVSKDDL